ncbi:MAG: serine/threonine-protein phosphatase [Planctomycetaceae bacterium]|nr:serine/threonine-protein phosphatase [Planctomycetaceae bacterium]
MYWEQTIQHATQTDLGLRRKNNEDSSIVHICTDYDEWVRRGHLFVVADGMGGHAVGELASRLAIETVPHAFLKSQSGDARTALKSAVELANEIINQRGTQNLDFLHMGTTCSTLTLTPRGALIAHVGDSRVYRVRRDRIDQLTFDHSLEWEIEHLHGADAGGIDLSQHRNVITRSLGPEESVRVDVEGPYPILPGDTFVLCSDGLSNPVSDPEIAAVVRELSPRQSAQLLVNLANIRGGPDNSTVIVVRVGDLPKNVAPPPPVEIPSADDESELGWGWLGAFWGVSMAIVLGLSIVMFGHPMEGGVVTGAGAIGLIVMLIAVVRRKRPETQRTASDDDSQTMLCRPHRTGTAKDSKAFLDDLLAMRAELERSAHEDGWNVDWKQHDTDRDAALEAKSSKRYGRGIRDCARAIDALMSKLPRGNSNGTK